MSRPPSDDAPSSKEAWPEGSVSKYCMHCGYVLDHLPEPRCPECGKAFDPADAESYRSEDREIGGRCLKLALICVLMEFGGLITLVLAILTGFAFFGALGFFIIGGGFFLAFAVFVGSISAIRDPSTERANRTSLWISMVLSGGILAMYMTFAAAASLL